MSDLAGFVKLGPPSTSRLLSGRRFPPGGISVEWSRFSFPAPPTEMDSSHATKEQDEEPLNDTELAELSEMLSTLVAMKKEMEASDEASTTLVTDSRDWTTSEETSDVTGGEDSVFWSAIMSCAVGEMAAWWDSFHSAEVAAVKKALESGGNIGSAPIHVWYGAGSSVAVAWLLTMEDKVVAALDQLPRPAFALDVGTGNGHMVRGMASTELFSSVTGTDYSSVALELSSMLHGESLGNVKLSWVHDDTRASKLPTGKFTVVVDKGCLDTVVMNGSLGSTPEERDADRAGIVAHIGMLSRVTVAGGLLIMVSCNHSSHELEDMFSTGAAAQWEVLVGAQESEQARQLIAAEDPTTVVVVFRRI